MQDVVQDSARLEHVADMALVVEEDRRLKNPEALLWDAEKAFHILADAF